MQQRAERAQRAQSAQRKGLQLGDEWRAISDLKHERKAKKKRHVQMNIALTSACASNKRKSIDTQNRADTPKQNLQLRRGFGRGRVHFDFHGLGESAFENGVQRVQHGGGLRARAETKKPNVEKKQSSEHVRKIKMRE